MFGLGSSSGGSLEELKKEGYESQSVHGTTVYFKSSDREAIRHLKYDLQSAEAKVFFEYARRHRSSGAEFEDDKDRQFTLKWIKAKSYMIERRP